MSNILSRMSHVKCRISRMSDMRCGMSSLKTCHNNTALYKILGSSISKTSPDEITKWVKKVFITPRLLHITNNMNPQYSRY